MFLIDDGQPARPSDFPVTAGFIPLVDCAPLLVAAKKGFARAEGLRLTLARETSWANIRDRVSVGHFNAAHMLGPMPIAASLGIGHFDIPMIAPFAFGLGGNAITVSRQLFAEMEAAGARLGDAPAAMGVALKAAIAARKTRGAPPLTLAMVFPFSGHNYELRYWLAASDIDPDRDLRLVVLPPPFTAEALEAGHIDGFCVGEPWNSLAVERAGGVIVATKAVLWRNGPEKVVGVQTAFAEREPDAVAALVRALWHATAWADDPDNRIELAALLSDTASVATPAPMILRALSGEIVARAGHQADSVEDFIVFHRRSANFPWQSHALWFYSQMVRWGQIDYSPEGAEIAAKVYRPDLYRSALAGTGADCPLADIKVEGAMAGITPVASQKGEMTIGPDPFFDHLTFDPADLEGYLHQMPIRAWPRK
jgi:NitT/TauT family transport system ATP-binding protein